jgi:hypothetical protein
MFAIYMLDPQFESLWVVKNFVGCGNAIWLAFKYDSKVVIPLFKLHFETINPTFESCKSTNYGDVLEDEGNMCLGLEHLLRSLFKHLSLNNQLC